MIIPLLFLAACYVALIIAANLLGRLADYLERKDKENQLVSELLHEDDGQI